MNARVLALFARIITAVGDYPGGQCYSASEALYHALGGKRSGWVPQVIRWAPGAGPICKTYGQHCHTHWYLRHRTSGVILDPTVAQFARDPIYDNGRGCGFCTRRVSKRGRAILERAGL